MSVAQGAEMNESLEPGASRAAGSRKATLARALGVMLISSPHEPREYCVGVRLWPAQSRDIFCRAETQSPGDLAHVGGLRFCRVHHGSAAYAGAYSAALRRHALVAEIVNHFSPLPPEFWRQASSLAHQGGRVADYVINQRGTLDPGELAGGLALVLLPGMLAAFALWLGMLVMFRRGGVGGALASLNAREPNQADIKELQLADVVQEMAIAAGLPAPG